MDTLILAVLIIGAVIGFYQGAFKQIANFIGVALGIILASMLYQQCGDFLADKSGASTGTAHAVAFVAIVILVPIVLGWIASLLTKAASSIHLGFLNRLAGAALGCISYGLVLSFAFNLMDFVESRYGYAPEKLQERTELYYLTKQASHPIVPDMLIVADSTEIANGAAPRCGIRNMVDSTLNHVVNGTLHNLFNTEDNGLKTEDNGGE